MNQERLLAEWLKVEDAYYKLTDNLETFRDGWEIVGSGLLIDSLIGYLCG